MYEDFLKWWEEYTSKGKIVIISANEYIHMKDIAWEAYKEGMKQKGVSFDN